MRLTGLFLLILAVGSLTFAGCKKTGRQESEQQFHGVKVDEPKLDAEFARADPDALASVSMVKRCLRYAQFPQALDELDRLSRNPNLTESQKKLVNDLSEQIKNAIAKAPPPER
jgi:hypothetical protein